jgi:BirA family transcriptional regulator, biotin operon repressor / biotin---[acetyl-CoA-carboxylase] ligase
VSSPAIGLPSIGLPSLGRPRVHLRSTDSTNDRARELAMAGAPHGTLVTAAEQTAGRGRQGRRWSAPAGSSLLMSLLLRPSPPGCVPPTTGSAGGGADRSLLLLPLIAAVAVCDVAGEKARIKWPNDVVTVQPKGLAKLAGILTEGRLQQGWAVLGIGLNVAVRLEDLPTELRSKAATLGESSEEIEPTLERLLRALEQRLLEPAEATLIAWRSRDALRGRNIAWAGGRGQAMGIDGTGRLVVALADGGHATLAAGEVHLEDVGRQPSTPP